jgi:hypothetical protein
MGRKGSMMANPPKDKQAENELDTVANTPYKENNDAATETEGEIENPQIESVEIQDTNPVRNVYKGLSKFSNPKYFNEGITHGKLDISSRNEEPKFIIISLSENKNSKFNHTPETESVLNGVESHICAGNLTVSVSQIARTVFNSNRQPTKKQEELVEAIIDQCRKTSTTCDWTQEARNRELELDGEKVTEFTYEDAILPARKLKIKTANGRTVTGYHFYSHSVFYEHDYQMKQFTRIPTKVINHVGDKVNMNIQSVIVREYLLKRIARMKHDKQPKNTKILFASILEQLENSQANTRSQKIRTRKTVDEILNALTESEYIKGYTKTKEGKEGYYIQL